MSLGHHGAKHLYEAMTPRVQVHVQGSTPERPGWSGPDVRSLYLSSSLNSVWKPQTPTPPNPSEPPSSQVVDESSPSLPRSGVPALPTRCETGNNREDRTTSRPHDQEPRHRPKPSPDRVMCPFPVSGRWTPHRAACVEQFKEYRHLEQKQVLTIVLGQRVLPRDPGRLWPHIPGPPGGRGRPWGLSQGMVGLPSVSTPV